MKFILVQLGVILIILLGCEALTSIAKRKLSIVSAEKAEQKLEAFDRACNTSVEKIWPGYFHACFHDRKFADGGKDLNHIVERILKHAEECIEISHRNCLLKRKSFERLMLKIIEQIQDYATMYLELIVKDRDKIKDLNCLETLTYARFERCLYKTFDYINAEEKELKRKVENSLSCFDEENSRCSCNAKSHLNKMVQKLFQLSDLAMPDCGKEAPKEEKPWRWYDYILNPLMSVWDTIKGFFGSWFG